MTKARWLGLGVGVLMILAAFGLVAWQSLSLATNNGIALAQTAPTPTPTTGTNPNPAQNKTAIGDEFWNALAAKLGVSADTLKADAIQVRKDMIDQAVKDGRLTQAQADTIKQKLDANGLIAPIFIGRNGVGPRGFGAPGAPGKGPGFRGGFGFGFGHSLDELEAVAKVLKLSPSDLTTQLRGGKTLADIAKAQSVDEATVTQAIIDAANADLAREVQDGTLTQAQADQIKAQLTPQNIDLTRFPFFYGPKGR